MDYKKAFYDKDFSKIKYLLAGFSLPAFFHPFTCAEDKLEFKVLNYQEKDGRMKIVAPSFLFEKDISTSLTLKIDGVYNAISGASPTGAPPITTTTRTITETTSAPVSSSSNSDDDEEDDDDDDDDDEDDDDKNISRIDKKIFHAFAAATNPAPSPTPTPITTTRTEIVALSEPIIPMVDVEDKRYGLNMELIKKFLNQALSTKLSYSTEDDYDSIVFAINDTFDFNEKNTSLNIGCAFNNDTIKLFYADGDDTKKGFDYIIGLTQLLGPNTFFKLNYTGGKTTGYLNDAYKVVEMNGVLIPEKRPDSKTKNILYFSITHFLTSLNASIEGSYRLYDDSFGINSNTYSLFWFQKIGEKFIIRPMIRYYDQSEADFYNVSFKGVHDEYSSDYRLSEFSDNSYGLKLIWNLSQNFTVDLEYEIFKLSGKDNNTVDEVYPEANIVTAGVKWWF